MLPYCLRRADSADRTFHLIPLVGLILLLATPLARADESDPADGDDAPPAHALGPVTVTATRAERDVLEVPGNVTVIDREEIERSGVRTVPELLRRESGLFVTGTTTNPAGIQVEARGFNNGGALGSSMLVQINGRRANEADTGNTDWALISLDEVESIEIVRGPASALYGDNAVGGVINIRTRPVEGPPRATLRGRVGRYASGEGSLKAAATQGPVTASLFVDGFKTDAYRHGADFLRADVKGTLQGTFGDRVLLGASGGFHRDERGLPGTLTQEEIDSLGRRARQPSSVDDRSAVDNHFVQGWLEAFLAENVELRIRPYYRGRDDDWKVTSIYEFLGVEYTYNQISDTEKASVGVDAQIQVDRPLFGLSNRLIGGFDFLREDVDRVVDILDEGFGDSTTFFDLTRDVYAGLLQDELYILENLILSAGVRFDHVALDLSVLDPAAGGWTDHPAFNVWSPKAAVTYRMLPALSAYFSYSRGFRLPNLDEDAPFLIFPGDPPDTPDLEPQISDSFEIGAKLRGERVDASIAIYHMNVHNEITYNPATFANENFDRVRHRGIESALNVRILEWLVGYATYTLEDVEIREADDANQEGRRMPITPLHRGTLGLFVRLPRQFEFTANANFVDERIVSNDFLREVEKLDPYATLDLLLAFRPTFGEHVDGAFTFAVRNVTGEEYEDLAVKSAFGSRVGFYPAAKRTWEVGFMLAVRR